MELYDRPEQGHLTKTNDSSDSLRLEAFQRPLAGSTNDSGFTAATDEIPTLRARPHASWNFGLLAHSELTGGNQDSTSRLPLWARMQPESPTFKFTEQQPKSEGDAGGDRFGFPPRKSNLMGGSEFFQKVLHVAPSDDPKNKGLQGADRERA